MANIVRELITKVTLLADTKQVNKFEAGINKLKKGLAALAGGYAIRQVYNYTKTLVKDTVDYYDELGESAQKLGVTTEALQKFRYSASISGISSEQLGVGIGILSKNLYEAQQGSKEAAETFAALKLGDPKQYKSTDTLILAISKKLEKLPDGPKKTALAMKIFGKSGKEMIPLLNNSEELAKQWRELEQMGGIATKEQLDTADRMDKQFRKVGMQIKTLTLGVGTKLLPEVEKITEAFSQWIVSDDAKNFASDLANILNMLVKVGGFIGLEFKQAAESANDFYNPKEGFFRKWKALPKGAVGEGLKEAGSSALSWVTGKTLLDYGVQQYKNKKNAEEQQKFKGFFDEATGKTYQNRTTVVIPRGKGQKGFDTKYIYENEIPKAPEVGDSLGLLNNIEKNPLMGATPANAPVGGMIDNSQKTQNVTYQNRFEINAGGLDPSLTEEVVAEGVKKAQEENNKRLGNNL